MKTNTFQIAKIRYEYTLSGKTATVTREDGAWAKFSDDENYINNWRDALMDMITDGDLYFNEV